MDPLSITASIIAILGLLSKSVKAAENIWGAPEELQELASELNELNALSSRLVAFTNGREFLEVDLRTLEEPYDKLKNAQKIFDQRLSKIHNNGASMSRLRRRTWVMNRGRIKKITRDVVAIRNQLSIAVLSLTLSSVLEIKGVQVQQSNSLGLVEQQTSRCEGLLHSVLERELVSEAHYITSISGNTPGDPSFVGNTHEQQSTEAAHFSDFLDLASQLSEGISDALSLHTPSANILDCPIATSSACYPEQYVTERPSYERLVVFSMAELSRTSTTRVDKYFILFAQDARHWRRVIVTATSATSLRLCEVSSSFLEKSYHVLPGMIQPRIENMLEQVELYDTVTNIHIRLELSHTMDVTFDREQIRVVEDTKEAAMGDTSSYMEELTQRGVRHYQESEVLVLSRMRTGLYLVVVEKQPCLERKLPLGNKISDRTLVDEFFDDMKLLQLAQGCPGVAKFVGVVINHNRTQICSYLVRYPEQGTALQVFENARLNNVLISWDRRVRWIRQIITTTAKIHQRGIAIGCLDFSALWLNLDDEIVLTSFKSAAGFKSNKSGFLAPELRRSTAKYAFASDQPPTYYSDVFQLGLIIWRLAEHIYPLGSGVFCAKWECPSFPRYRCTADHANPVELPPCNSEVPAFVNALVYRCRQRRPCERTPANALLKLLPADKAMKLFCPTRIYPCYSAHLRYVACNECSKILYNLYYHCDICEQGDFDLCPECISKDVSCFDDSHKLCLRVSEKMDG